ncbi:hypothetical protein B0A48_01981 [Cryoendolithus antarcticus]|uniref:Dienelactone hydrolase domain-containing protein n=1 Tax=Cryoendolithus antarcticus TaxID=1507870 RepID=A0A1V8TR72_9PEZI|nr:hypothetical protein B0A48_01981 [Cryoendolithus antarcticus]
MTSSFTPSAACCSNPPIVGPSYDSKGTFIEVAGTRVYTASLSPEPPKRALLILYDIFGYSGQILQGADFLAQHFRVFMPDFFDGKPAPLSWMPMEGPADEDAMDEFCSGPGGREKTLGKMDELMVQFKQQWPEFESWGTVGYCWGGWIAPYAVGKDTQFKACAMLHPGFPGAKVAGEVTVPVLALCSKDERESEYAEFKPALKTEHEFHEFPEMVHGWMAARGDLGSPEVERDFWRGYELVLHWFQQHL